MIADVAARAATRTTATPAAPPFLRLAYLTTEYPKVSHTFIRREIAALEAAGCPVRRFAIRGAGGAISDPADRAEAARTFVCLEQSAARLLGATLRAALAGPARFAGALRAALRMSRRSDRGLLRHLAYLAEAALLREELRVDPVDHLHVHFGTNAAAVARILHALGGPGWSFTIHGPDEWDAPIGLGLAEKIDDARFVVAISDYCAAQIRRWIPPAQWSKIEIVRCAVNEAFLDATEPVDPACRTLLSVGRLSAQKGQLLLLEAMATLVADGMDARLVLAGDGELRPLVEARIEALGLRDHVTITGWIGEAEVRELLRDCRALVQPSFAEGLPVVMMEALARGRPVIATCIAGVPELVRERTSGWLVTAGSVPQLVAAMRDALVAPAEKLDALGRAGRAAVVARHRAANEAARLAQRIARAVGDAEREEA